MGNQEDLSQIASENQEPVGIPEVSPWGPGML